MSVVKIQDFDPKQVEFNKQFVFYKGTNLLLHLQTDFESTKPYGIPKRSDYLRSDKDRQFIQLPLYNNLLSDTLRILDKHFNRLIGDDYVSFIKPDKGYYPEYIKITFNKITQFTLLNKDDKIIDIKYNTIDQLRDDIKFYYPIRFLISFTKWTYMGKQGIKLFATHVQSKEILYDCNIIPEGFLF